MPGLKSHFTSPFSYLALCILIIALLSRFYCLDCKGLWYDEVASLDAAVRGLPALLTDRFGWMSVQTPLHYFIVWLTAWPIDPAHSAIIVRLPSALGGALATLVLYGIGRELFGRAQGLVAALALALSAVHIGYSQDLRPYSLVVLFTLLSVYCLLVAERAGARKWWIAFVLSTVANLYLSYFALTFALPALAPYLLWLFLRMRKAGTSRYLLLSLLAIGITAIPVALDLSAVPRNAPDWTMLTPSLVLTQYTVALTQLTKIGIGGSLEVMLQWLFLVMSISGILFGIRDKKWSGVILCSSFVLVPSLLLAIFRTGNTVFQRYILFTLPFYILLIAHAMFALWTLLSPPTPEKRRSPVPMYALAVLLLLPFAYSTWVYFDPAQYRVFNTQPDYRAVSQYLSTVAHPDDLILVSDEPALGATVLSYYWGENPPAPFFDARDPRVPWQTSGSIYLIVSFFQNDATFLDRLGAPSNNWAGSQRFQRVAVLKSPDNNTSRTLDHLATLLETENAHFQPVLTLRGSISQSSNLPEAAATAYREAGPYFGTGDEYLRTANGYLQRGDRPRAWREALVSKFMQPANSALHEWLAARLLEDGHTNLSNIEQQIANRLATR